MTLRWQHRLTSIAFILSCGAMWSQSARAQQDCVALNARLGELDRQRDGNFRVDLRKSGFATTMADWLPEQDAKTATAMSLEAVESLDALDKLIASVQPTDAIDDINSLGELLYDPVLRHWTPQQAQSLLGLSAEQRQILKKKLDTLRQLSQQVLETRERLVEAGCPAANAPPASSIDANLAAAARQIQSGDAADALAALDRVEKNVRSQAPALARVNAYRTWAHVELRDRASAREDAHRALTLDRNVSVTAAEFPREVVALFEAVKNQARVWVYFPSTAKGGVTSPVFCDSAHEGDLGPGRFLIFDVSPGPHAIAFQGKKYATTIAGRETYYFRVGVEGSGRGARYTLRTVTKDDGSTEIYQTNMTYAGGTSPDCESQAEVP